MSEVVALAAGGASLRIAPALGGRITSLRLVGPDGIARAALLPFPEGTDPSALLHWPKGGLYPLLPYGNRIKDARLAFAGRSVALPPHPDARPHTLHGHAHRVAWRSDRVGEADATWTLEHDGSGEWPWPFRATMGAALTPSAATVRIAIENAGADPMPAGIGLHPYFLAAPGAPVGFRAGLDWPATADFLAGDPRPIPPDHDPPRPLPPGALTVYRSGWDGGCTLDLTEGGTLALRADPVFSHLVVHQPDGAAYLCLEPTSHAPDGFNAAERGVPGTGRVVLRPGETLGGAMTLTLG